MSGDYRNLREDRTRTEPRVRPGAPVERPIFLIGCGRSGTTLLYNILCGHPSLAWFSNYTNRWPGLPQLAALSRSYAPMKRRRVSLRRAPVPSEGYRIFDYYSPRSGSDNNKPLIEMDVNPVERIGLRRAIATHVRFGGGHRFVNKNTRNTRRIRFLRELFPDACFVHVVRDPRATAASLLRVAFWPELRFWWRDNRSAEELPIIRPETLAGELWVREVGAGLRDGLLDASSYMEVRYEDLVTEPRTLVTRVLEFVDLEWSDSFESVFRSFQIEDRIYKYRRSLHREQIGLIDDVTRELAQELGYPPDRP